MKILLYLIITSICVGAIALFKTKDCEYSKISGLTEGTLYHITYENVPGKNLQKEVDSLLHDIDLSLSSYIDNSLISKINKSDTIYKLDKYFLDVYDKALEVNKNTHGFFDITVGPLVDAWGFGSGRSLVVDSAVIDSLLQFVGMAKVKLAGGFLYKSDPRIRIDVNAIAQGYAVDVVAKYLENYKIKNYLVEIGGEIRARGKNPKHLLWKVGIDKPNETQGAPGTQIQVIVDLNNQSLATSGNYRKFYEQNGIKFTHTINPKTGYTVSSNLLSATVFAKDCITADAYATACMVMGLEGAKELLEKNKKLQAYLVYTDSMGNYKIYYTKSLQEFIEK